MTHKIITFGFFMVISFALSGCSSLFFYPQKEHIQTPEQLGLEYKDVYLISNDGTKIHGWFLPTQKPVRGTVYFLHGNAENISTHIHSVEWLPEEGYQLFLLDYRGYGKSEGKAQLPGAIEDIEAGFEWLLSEKKVTDYPIYLLGQSLGGSLGLYFAATNNQAKTNLSGVVSDAAFTSYSDISKHVANQHWLTWVIQYPVAWSVVQDYDPIDYISQIAPTPILLFHSPNDQIIPYSYGEELFQAAKEPKQLIRTSGPHIATFSQQRQKQALLNFFEENRVFK
ncbi:MAG: alpha/beta hydrolase [Gammaproteobacteria bacterium]|nr:alpha/beta hydrolase [Gammaproteobacteria bacterium]